MFSHLKGVNEFLFLFYFSGYWTSAANQIGTKNKTGGGGC